ncbi:FkbM family methyltransferase [Nocardioides sp.]|uniref:FkbM family methyltransferase n=1 Tax=Nocardioides sp. TaxID=35761 RepID=UPI002EDA1ACE
MSRDGGSWTAMETTLPDGTPWWTASPGDTRMLYDEIFVDRVYADFARRAAESGLLVVDVGANTGLSTLYVARHASAVPILAVEPVPLTYSCLAQNLLRHVPTATTVQGAIGAVQGAVELTYYPRAPSQSGLHAAQARDDALTAAYLRNIGFDDIAVDEALQGLHEGVRVKVPSFRLDVLLDAFRPDLDTGIHLKIDVERAEEAVLAGIGDRWSSIDGVVCEVEDSDGALGRILKVLDRHGLHAQIEQQETLADSPLWTVVAARETVNRRGQA